MLLNSINSALNGLATFESKLHESAQNIANFPTIDEIQNEQIINSDSSENIDSQNEKRDFVNSFRSNEFDLPRVVVNMKLAQRGYEANLTVFKTVDSMVESVINLLS